VSKNKRCSDLITLSAHKSNTLQRHTQAVLKRQWELENRAAKDSRRSQISLL